MNDSRPMPAFRSVNVVPEVVIDAAAGDAGSWVPIAAGVHLRPFLFDCSNGGWSSLIKIAPGGRLACHYHTQPVYGYTLAGSWRYLEHDWVARPGTFIFEPPGEMHTLQADEKDGMTTFFVTRGALVYTDAAGQQIGYEDVFTRLALARAHYRANSLDERALDRMVR